MSISWGLIISVTLFAAFSEMYVNQVTLPSCHNTFPLNAIHIEQTVDSQDLTAILVSNLLLQASNFSLFDFFRDFFLSQFFKKSYEILKPDMLLVLGDVSEKGFQLTRKEWPSIVDQFHNIIGPYLRLPFHVTLGDKDIGECSKLKIGLVNRVSRSFPELNYGGCGGFEMKNVSFLSLNSMALLCGNNELLLDVETFVERESAYLRTKIEDNEKKIVKLDDGSEVSGNYKWRENHVLSQSGPVLLLHFPLGKVSERNCRKEGNFGTFWRYFPDILKLFWRRESNSGPYDLLHTVPPNATEYIFQALKPRIVFSGHSHEYCENIHPDGTREVTVPAMSWKAKDNPGFIIANFKRNGGMIVRFCSLPREFHVLVSFISIFVLSMSPTLISLLTQKLFVKQNRLPSS